MMITLTVYTLNENIGWGVGQLCRLWRESKGDRIDVRIDFSGCNFLRQYAVAFLGGLARLVQSRGGTVEFAWDTLKPGVQANLAQNGFMAAFGAANSPWNGNSVPFREDSKPAATEIINYLKSNWLGQGWMNISKQLQDAIIGTVWEIYANAFEHSGSQIGVFTCGQHFPKLHTLDLAVVDFGQGIPANVRAFKNNENITADSALQWAFQRGTTTRPSGTGRGMGLDLLKEFVRVNKGKLEVFSREGHALIDETQEKFTVNDAFFDGTLLNITFRCDSSFYRLASEDESESLF